MRKRLVWCFPPLIVLIAMLVTFQSNGLYPFGAKTIAWCDMEQQVIPLLLDFKDVLAGKENFFFSLKNASGMNFYGVFFFFLASPFTFLVAFVDKAEIISFCNVLVLLKMATCALTASLYFYKKNPNAPLLNVCLSVLYAYSGYVMMYYQNVMWLDVAYLFPLLLWGLESLQQGKKTLFIASLSASVTVNYYLGYMLVVFLLLYAFLWVLLTKDREFALRFLFCSLAAALLTAVVWLPSLWQYLSSGRTTSIAQNIQSSSLLTPYTTTVPTLLSTLFLFPFAWKAKTTPDQRLRRLLWIATLIPVVLEPVNKMWQTGSYMSFPTRYAFITIFLCLTLAFDSMGRLQPIENEGQSDKPKWQKELPRYALSILLVAISIGYCAFSYSYTKANVETMDQYSHSLWGNTQSFESLLSLYTVALLVGGVAFLLWRFRLLKPILLWLAVGVLVASELYVAPMTYMLTPAHDVDGYRQVVELADKIEDEGFYRVKTDKEYSGRDFDVNMMGGLGYNALGHYTSLTKQKYMQTIKRFGYTSYWMEVGNSGGTLLTDALLSIKYQISSQTTERDVYQGSYFHIAKTQNYLSLGALAKRDVIALEKERGQGTRGEMQRTLYEDFFGEEGITVLELSDAVAHGVTVRKEGEKYRLIPAQDNAYLSFSVPVERLSTLYFSAFDENTNALKQAIDSKFTVQAKGYFVSAYPTQKQNGILKVGEYEEPTTVKIGVKSETLVKEMSVVALENDKTSDYIEQTPTLNLQLQKGKIGGRYAANGGECVFLSVAYDEGLSLKINGKPKKLYEVYGGFTAFYLEDGVNEIQISFQTQGFSLGLWISILGGGLALLGVGLYEGIRRKLSLRAQGAIDGVAYFATLAIGGAVLLGVYILPVIWSLL